MYSEDFIRLFCLPATELLGEWIRLVSTQQPELQGPCRNNFSRNIFPAEHSPSHYGFHGGQTFGCIQICCVKWDDLSAISSLWHSQVSVRHAPAATKMILMSQTFCCCFPFACRLKAFGLVMDISISPQLTPLSKEFITALSSEHPDDAEDRTG